MKKLLLLLSLVDICIAQQTVTFTAPTPPSVSNVSATITGNIGITTYYYWVIAKYPAGNAAPSNPVQITTAPNTLSGSNFVTVSWSSVANATSYDVLRTTTNILPATPAAIAVATAISGTSTNDIGSALGSYTITTIPPARETWFLDNQDCSSPIVQMPSIKGTTAIVCTPGFLRSSNNLSDVANVTTARTNLGLGTASILNSGQIFQVANNLSEGTASTMRTNLGLGSVATLNSTQLFQVTNNLSEGTPSAMRTSLGLGTSALLNSSQLFQVTNNLSEGIPATMRTSLGLGSVALLNTTAVAQVTNNLSEFTATSATARTNLGVTQAWIGANLVGSTLTGGNVNTLLGTDASTVLRANLPVTFTSNTLSAVHYASTSGTPTASPLTGAGTGGTVSIAGNDVRGKITVTTGSAPASNAGIANMAFNTAYTVAPDCLIAPETIGTSTITNAAFVNGTTTAGFSISIATALVATTTYVWTYHCLQ